MNINFSIYTDKLPSSSSLSSITTSNNHHEILQPHQNPQQQQKQQQQQRTINCRRNIPRNLDEFNLFFDEKDERAKINLLSINEDENGIKSPEISDHVQFLITEVSSSDAEKGNRKVNKEDELTDDSEYVANGT